MFCGKCGNQIKEGAKFCAHCGSPVVKNEPDQVASDLNNINHPNIPKNSNKDGNKKATVIAIIVAAIICGGVACAFLLSDEGDKQGEKSEVDITAVISHSEPEETLIEEEYFEEITEIEILEETEPETEEMTEEITEEITEAPEPEPTPVEDFILNSGNRLFTLDDIKDFTAEDCRIARNSVYARYGRKFKDQALTEYFLQFEWYMPRIESADFDDSVLNFYERENLLLIVSFEEEKGYR